MHIKHRRGPSRLPHEDAKRDDEGSGLEGRQLTTPVTLTVVFTHQLPSTSLPTPPLTATTAAPLETTELPQSPDITTLPLPNLTIQTPTSETTNLASTTFFTIESQSSSLSPVTSPPVPSAAPSSASSVPKIPDLDGNTTTSNPVTLPSGAIVGIVIGCLVVLLVAVLVGLRKRTVRNRLKLRGVWMNSKVMGLRGNLRPTPYTYNPQEESTVGGNTGVPMMGFTGQPVSAKPSQEVISVNSPKPPPSAYKADFSPTSPVSALQIQVLYTVIVARSFVVSLPDELSISLGETLKVLQVFDDGWAECMTLSGETGMVPLECFERRSSEGTISPTTESSGSMIGGEVPRNSRRFSSLPGAR